MEQPTRTADILDFAAFREGRIARQQREARAARSRYLLWYPGIGYLPQSSSVARLSPQAVLIRP